MPDKIIEIKNVHKWFGRTHALNDVSLDVEEGEVVVIIGPSGSGKSTLLRSINHLEAVNSGDITVDGIALTQKSTDINAVRAEVGMVFQQFNLFPHLTALENISLAQRIVRKRDGAEAEKKARALLERVGIPEKADSYPGPALRRPAAARRHRPRPGDGPEDHALRRADQRARPRNDQGSAGRHAGSGERGHDDGGGLT